MKKTALSLLISLIFFSCKKKEEFVPGELTLAHNGPVVVGWNLRMNCGQDPQVFRVWWDGPNGWKYHPATRSNQDYIIERTNVSLQDGGEYTVSWVDNNDDVMYQGKANIEVIPPPNPPCTITPNTSSSSGPFGSYNYTGKSFSVMSGSYTVTGTAGSASVTFLFWGNGRPIPGVYRIDPKYYVDEWGTVGLKIDMGGSTPLSALGGDVYVTAGSNGKLSVSFCDVHFNNPINSAVLVIKGNVTEP